MNAELEKWVKEHSYRCDKHGTKEFAYIDDLRALFDGKVLVPVEPTIEMIAALGWGGDVDMAIGHAHISAGVEDAYKAMLATSRQQERIADLEAQRAAYLDGKCVCPHSTAGSASHYPGCPQRQQERTRELEADAARYQWLKRNVGETLTEESLKNTIYVFPRLLSWADFCGPITLDEAIDFKIEQSLSATAQGVGE